jgi:hypothetical protein
MGRMPSIVAIFGPSLLLWLALAVITLFTSIHNELSRIRTEVVELQERRAEFAAIVDVEAELGMPSQTSDPTSASFGNETAARQHDGAPATF